MRVVDRLRSLVGERPWPLHPVFLGAYFVLFLYSVNLEETELGDVLPVLLFVVLGIGLVLMAFSRLLREPRRAGLIVTTMVVAGLAYGHVAGVLTPYRIGAGIQQLAWSVLIGLTIVMAWRAGRWLKPVTRALNLGTAALVVVTLALIVPHQLALVAATGSVSEGQPSDGPVANDDLPDIYYLVFDRYPSQRSSRLAYGIENDLFDKLRDRGFYIADKSHANYQRTTLSLASTLSAEFLDGRGHADLLGPTDRSGSYTRIQNSNVARFLKAQGYFYVHIGSDFSPTRTSVLADVNRHYDSFSDFGAAFVDSTAVPGIARRLGLLGSRWERRYTWTRWELELLESLPPYPSPSFVFGHLMLPHTPYIFEADGDFISDPEKSRVSHRDQFVAQLTYTNERLLAIVDHLLAAPPESRPIIILQADEGPYPADLEDETRHDWTTASAEEREIKFGILNAWYLPDGRDIGLYPEVTSVNTFRVLFNAYFDADLPLLPDESFSLDHREPLEFPPP